MRNTLLTEAYLAGFSELGLGASEIHSRVRDAVANTSYEGRSLSRPGFLDHASISQLICDLDQLYSTLTGLPDQLFGGDLSAFARAVGASAAQAEVILRARGDAPSRMGRADFYLTESGFQLMEVNWGAALGGLDGAILNRAMLEHPYVAAFVREHGLGYVDPLAELVHTLLTECHVTPGDRPTVALTDWPSSFAHLEPQLRTSAAILTPFGMDVYPCHLGQLRYADGGVWLGQRRVDVVYRLFLMEDLLTDAGPALIQPVLRAAERGEVAIFSPMDSDLYGSKGALALLSDEENRRLWPPAALAALDRILPWTRMVRPGPVTVAGTTVDLAGYALAEQQELILKPTMMHGGQGIAAGWLTEPAEWRARLEAAMDQPYVLQRRIHAVPEKFPTDTGTEEWTLSWGAFMVSRGYGGMWLRGSRDPDATVNMMSGATATCCFTELPATGLPGRS
ncbi:MAG: hypothetical protein QOE23_2640 [Pseudonocardiales bacterium]|jgi:hypothetical protein|nr:hypothetical protein [Pseudonocardiales bacterium]